MGYGGMGFTDASGRFVGPAEQVTLRANQALFGEVAPDRGYGMTVESWSTPDGPTLPEILARERGRGWLGEGITRLYMIEGLVQKFGGQFERLDVGPATVKGIRVEANFRPAGHGERVATIQGLVPFGF